MIRGYNEYQSIWEAEVWENLTCIREPDTWNRDYASKLDSEFADEKSIFSSLADTIADEGTSLEKRTSGVMQKDSSYFASQNT